MNIRDMEKFIGNLDSEETYDIANQCLEALTKESAFKLVMLWLNKNDLLVETSLWIDPKIEKDKNSK